MLFVLSNQRHLNIWMCSHHYLVHHKKSVFHGHVCNLRTGFWLVKNTLFREVSLHGEQRAVPQEHGLLLCHAVTDRIDIWEVCWRYCCALTAYAEQTNVASYFEINRTSLENLPALPLNQLEVVQVRVSSFPLKNSNPCLPSPVGLSWDNSQRQAHPQTPRSLGPQQSQSTAKSLLSHPCI